MLGKIRDFVIGLAARLQSEVGQALAEYGLILALIAAAAIILMGVLALAISGTFEQVAECRI
jgi:Flp pilus assembly pilin Flp